MNYFKFRRINRSLTSVAHAFHYFNFIIDILRMNVFFPLLLFAGLLRGAKQIEKKMVCDDSPLRLHAVPARSRCRSLPARNKTLSVAVHRCLTRNFGRSHRRPIASFYASPATLSRSLAAYSLNRRLCDSVISHILLH